MDFKKLLENKILLASIVGGIVLLLVIFIICGTVAASKKADKDGIDVSAWRTPCVKRALPESLSNNGGRTRKG